MAWRGGRKSGHRDPKSPQKLCFQAAGVGGAIPPAEATERPQASTFFLTAPGAGAQEDNSPQASCDLGERNLAELQMVREHAALQVGVASGHLLLDVPEIHQLLELPLKLGAVVGVTLAGTLRA